VEVGCASRLPCVRDVGTLPQRSGVSCPYLVSHVKSEWSGGVLSGGERDMTAQPQCKAEEAVA
jgi:hypothetical protein